ncbi:MAG: hypothetical protein KJ578_02750 [Bacteroidetes bacterium]|nr:hypothetical protein [Bacteroidota bacterium]MBU1578408.1 hypothetical protein [Bacteroidota bacterium]MBU2556680.1 hypothetical protein [Bacteroidota bacterium]
MRKLLILLVFSTFVMAQAIAQKQLSVNTRFKLEATNSGREASRNKQWVFYTIINAESNGQATKSAYWDIEAALSLNPTPYQTTLINIDFDRIKSLQAISYRGTALTNLIVPDVFKGRFELISQNGRLWKRYFEVELPLQQRTDLQISHVDLKANEQRFQNANLTDFDFSAKKQLEIEKVLHQINTYYGALHLFEKLVDTRDTDESDPISLFLAWDAVRKALNQSPAIVDAKSHYFSEDQRSELLSLIEQLRRKQLRFETLLDQSLNDKINIRLNAEQFAQRFAQELIHHRKVATTVDFRDYEIFYEVSGIHADSAFRQRLQQFANFYSGNELQNAIVAMLLEEINLLLDKEDHANAYYLSHQLSLSDLSRNNNQQTQAIVQVLSLSRAGVLDAYFQINNKALEADNEKMAALYFAKSRAFFAQAYQNIPDDAIRLAAAKLIGNYTSKARILLQNNQTEKAIAYLEQAAEAAILFDNRSLQNEIRNTQNSAYQKGLDEIVKQALAFSNQGMENEALIQLEKADQFHQQHSNYIANSNELAALKQRLGEPVFTEKLQSGIDAANSGDNDLALKTLAAAKQLNAKGQFNAAESSELTTELAKPLIVEKIRTANQKVWANKLDEAWSVYHEAAMIAEEFGLQNDPEIKAAFQSLDAKIIERICMNHQQEYDRYMLDAERAVRFKKIADLRRALASAREIVDKNRGCNIEASQLLNYEHSFEASFAYWEAYQNVLDRMYAAGFEASIPAYLELDKQADKFDLTELGYVHQDMFAFLNSQQNPTLTALALNYFIEQEDYAEAKAYFDLLLIQYPDYKQFDDVLKKSAMAFAAYDAQKFPEKSRDELLQAYGENIADYRVFVKTYRKHF